MVLRVPGSVSLTTPKLREKMGSLLNYVCMSYTIYVFKKAGDHHHKVSGAWFGVLVFFFFVAGRCGMHYDID